MPQSAGSDFSSSVSQVPARRLSTRGIFPDQGSNLCLLRWQADPLPLSRQGSPSPCLHRVFLLHVSISLPLLRGTLLGLNQGPPSSPHFNLITSFQIQSPEVLAARTSTDEFGRRHSSAYDSLAKGANFSSFLGVKDLAPSHSQIPILFQRQWLIASLRFCFCCHGGEMLQPRGYDQKKVRRAWCTKGATRLQSCKIQCFKNTSREYGLWDGV